jgi:hypothetical protein
LQNELPELLEGVPLATRAGGMYFQHDGAPPHFSRAVMQHINNNFPSRWIDRGGQHNWPPRSPDLYPMDYGLWGWIKSQVYEIKVNARTELLARILDAAACIKERHEQHVIFANQLQSALRLKVEFSKTYCKHKAICFFLYLLYTIQNANIETLNVRQ